MVTRYTDANVIFYIFTCIFIFSSFTYAEETKTQNIELSEIDLPHEPKIITGQLSIDSEPREAKVYLNGKLLESNTPTTVKELIPGRHEVKVVKSNFGTVSKYIYVYETETTSVMLNMPNRNKQIGLFTAIIIIGGIAIGAITTL